MRIKNPLAALAEMKKQVPGFAMVAFSDLNGMAFSDTDLQMDRSDGIYIKTVRETLGRAGAGPRARTCGWSASGPTTRAPSARPGPRGGRARTR